MSAKRRNGAVPWLALLVLVAMAPAAAALQGLDVGPVEPGEAAAAGDPFAMRSGGAAPSTPPPYPTPAPQVPPGASEPKIVGHATDTAADIQQEGDAVGDRAGDEVEGAQRDAEAKAARVAQEGEARTAAPLATAESAIADPLGFVEAGIVRPAEQEVARLAADVLPEEDAAPEEETRTQAALVDVVPTDASLPMILAGATAAAVGVATFWFLGSSGAIGSAGSAGAKAMGSELRRVLPYASPLFTRFERDTVMGHPKREELYALIVDEPGIALSKLCTRTGLSRTAVMHHLRLLEHHHVIVSKRLGRSRHYYENGGRYGRDQKEAYAVLQNERSREVARFIRDNPGSIQKSLCTALGLQASIAHWHVRRLQEAALVEPVRQGRTVSYFPTADLQQIA